MIDSTATRRCVAAMILSAAAAATPPVVSADNARPADAAPTPKRLTIDRVVAWSVDGGGGASAGGNFALTATVGQPDAGMVTRCGTALDGGLWGAAVDLQAVFCNGFESGDSGAWSSTSGGTE